MPFWSFGTEAEPPLFPPSSDLILGLLEPALVFDCPDAEDATVHRRFRRRSSGLVGDWLGCEGSRGGWAVRGKELAP